MLKKISILFFCLGCSFSLFAATASDIQKTATSKTNEQATKNEFSANTKAVAKAKSEAKAKASALALGNNLLINSCIGKIDMVDSLIKLGANVNAIDYPLEHATPLMFAAGEGHLSIVKKLLAAGANPNLQDLLGRTALMYAAQQDKEAGQKDKLAIIALLLDAGANPCLVDYKGNTPFFHAIQNRLGKVAALLAFASVSHVDCVTSGAVDQIIGYKNTVNFVDDLGHTLLMAAAGEGFLLTTKKILARGVDPNLKDNTGYTALMYACVKGSADVVEALLAAGADPCLADNEGNLPIAYAVKNGLKRIASRLALIGVARSSCLPSTAIDLLREHYLPLPNEQ